jgi:uncharacterized delta-60 repeat protein
LSLLAACEDSSSSDGEDSKDSGSVTSDAGKDSGNAKPDSGAPVDEEDAAIDEEDAAIDEEDAAIDEEDAAIDEEDAAVDMDGAVETDAGLDASSGEKVVFTTISATGHDRYYGVTHDGDGNIYAVGQSSSGTENTSDYAFVLAKYLPSGELDETFGNGGIVLKNLSVSRGGPSREIARGVVIQSTGKIVVAGTVDHEPIGTGPAAADTDIALVRFNANGSLDTGFGTNGVKRLDLTTPHVYQPATLADGGVPPPALSAADTQYSLTLAAEDKLVIHGTEGGAGFKASEPSVPRIDSDWSLIRLTADGEPDTTFNTTGRVSLDIKEGGGTARAATVLADGSIIGVGYTSVSGILDTTTTNRQQPVLYKVSNTGVFDPTFATADQYAAHPGVFYDFVTPTMTNAEAYGAAPQGDKFVTVGYGPTNGSGTGSDFIFARFNQDGSQDKSFGTGGTTYLDPGGYGDNGRAITVLPDDRILGAGGGRATPAVAPDAGVNPPTDGMLGILLPDGAPDPSFGTNGVKLYDLGGTSDFFWAVSVAPDEKSVAVVGIKGAASPASDDDAALLILQLP